MMQKLLSGDALRRAYIDLVQWRNSEALPAMRRLADDGDLYERLYLGRAVLVKSSSSLWLRTIGCRALQPPIIGTCQLYWISPDKGRQWICDDLPSGAVF